MCWNHQVISYVFSGPVPLFVFVFKSFTVWNNPSQVSNTFQSDKNRLLHFVGGDIVLHRLEQLAPFPAMSIAVVCSVDAQGRLNHQVSSKKQKRKPQIATKATPVWFKHVWTVNSNLRTFNATLLRSIQHECRKVVKPWYAKMRSVSKCWALLGSGEATQLPKSPNGWVQGNLEVSDVGFAPNTHVCTIADTTWYTICTCYMWIYIYTRLIFNMLHLCIFSRALRLWTDTLGIHYFFPFDHRNRWLFFSVLAERCAPILDEYVPSPAKHVLLFALAFYFWLWSLMMPTHLQRSRFMNTLR